MILDDIIELIVALFKGVIGAFALLINLIAAGIELLVGLFSKGFTVGRVGKKKSRSRGAAEGAEAGDASSLAGGAAAGASTNKEAESAADARLKKRGLVSGVIFIVVIGAWIFIPMILNRDITFVAEDGHTLPLAGVIIHSKGGDEKGRTDEFGGIEIPRFGTTGITIKDPRYVKKTWDKSEIESKLVVKRSLLGRSLDIVVEGLKKPDDE